MSSGQVVPNYVIFPKLWGRRLNYISTEGLYSPETIPKLDIKSIGTIYPTTVLLIISISKVIPSCFYYFKKGLVYIIIAAPSSH